MASGIPIASRALRSLVRPAGARRQDGRIGSLLVASGGENGSLVPFVDAGASSDEVGR